MDEDYKDNRALQPQHGRRTYIPTADEQFSDIEDPEPDDIPKRIWRRWDNDD